MRHGHKQSGDDSGLEGPHAVLIERIVCRSRMCLRDMILDEYPYNNSGNVSGLL
jgi:hypothetical protein